jgi:hypothetical protein
MQWGDAVARRTILCLMLFPTSLFFSAAYSESLFLALVLAAFAAAEGRYWWAAGVLAALAALARVYGGLILLPLLWIYIRQRGLRLAWPLMWLGLIPAAVLGWLTYLYAVSGDPFVLLHAAANWEGFHWQDALSRPNVYIGSLSGLRGMTIFLLDLVTAVGFGVLVVLAWTRLRDTSLALFATLFYLATLLRIGVGAEARYVIELFPAFVVMALLTRKRSVLIVYVGVAGFASIIAMSLFAVGEWVA